MKKRLSLSYRTNVINYTDNALNKKNFFSAFSEYFVLFFDFSGLDKNSFYSTVLKLKKNRFLGNFVQLKRFLTRTLSFLPSGSGANFVRLQVNNLLLANDVGFIGLLLMNREAFFERTNVIFSFYDFCFCQKFVNPFGKKFILNSSLGLDFFFKPLLVKLSNFLICPKFFGNFIHFFYTLGNFSLRDLQVSRLLIIPRIFFLFFSFFGRFLLLFLRKRWLH